MNNRMIGTALLVVGVLLALLGLLADAIGVGTHPGFGWTQILVLLVGIVLAIVGFVMLVRAPGARP